MNKNINLNFVVSISSLLAFFVMSALILNGVRLAKQNHEILMQAISTENDQEVLYERLTIINEGLDQSIDNKESEIVKLIRIRKELNKEISLLYTERDRLLEENGKGIKNKK